MIAVNEKLVKVAELLKAGRMEAGLTVEQVADQIGVSCRDLLDYESAFWMPMDISITENHCKAVGVSMSDLINSFG